MGCVIKGFPQQWERPLIGGVEGQSDFTHLLLVALATFTPTGARRWCACVSNYMCVTTVCAHVYAFSLTKKDTRSFREWSLQCVPLFM